MSSKAVIIGLDGVSFSLLNQLAEEGVMPFFRELKGKGCLNKMRTSLPEISSVAWTSFMTGKNPGEHGIFGFMELRPGSYEMYFPNYGDVKQPTFWESAGVPSVILNIPQTYPAKPFNGVMTSGFVAVDLKKATYPDSAYQYLNSIGYRIDVNAGLARTDTSAFFRDLHATLDKRTEAIRHFFETEDWRIFVGTITETDRLHHFFYDSAQKTGAHHDEFLRFYRRLDEFIEEMHQKAASRNALFMTCSDHGFTTIKTEVYLNQWLIQEGFLEIGDRDKGLDTISSDSQAFCLDPSRIYIHRSGKYPKGCVDDNNYDAVRDSIKQRLTSLTFQGDRVVDKVFFREEIFTGPYAVQGPDLYVLPRYGFDLKGTLKKTAVFGTSHFTGMHTYDDAHVFTTGECPDPVSIDKIAAMVTRHVQ
jgi:predicted AlkP superfamily phosphohydrolase/phosphomutase